MAWAALPPPQIVIVLIFIAGFFLFKYISLRFNILNKNWFGSIF